MKTVFDGIGIGGQRQLQTLEEITVDNFAGGGGASTGIALGLGREIDIAINHNEEALDMHARNHPSATHLCESVFDIDPDSGLLSMKSDSRSNRAKVRRSKPS